MTLYLLLLLALLTYSVVLSVLTFQRKQYGLFAVNAAVTLWYFVWIPYYVTVINS